VESVLKLENIKSEVINLYNDKLYSVAKISRIFNYTIKEIKDFLIKNNIKIRNNKESADLKFSKYLSKAFEIYLKNQNLERTCELFPFSTTYLKRKLKENNIFITRRFFTESDEKEVIAKYVNELKNIDVISKELNWDEKLISTILKRNNIETDYSRNASIHPKELNNIINLYLIKKYKAIDIANIYKVSITAVLNFLRRNKINIKRRKDYSKYKFNENYFEVIDSEDKAYFLGLLYADGNISKNMIRLQLQAKDKKILQIFKKKLNSNLPIRLRNCFRFSKQDQFLIYIISQKMTNDLIDKGCMRCKSLILKFPNNKQVPYHLIHHFIRGYFDGDGCICLSGPLFTITSTEDVCQNINIIINEHTKIGIKKLSKHPNNITKNYRVGGSKQLKKIFDFLYKDANFYLQRKYQKFLQI